MKNILENKEIENNTPLKKLRSPYNKRMSPNSTRSALKEKTNLLHEIDVMQSKLITSSSKKKKKSNNKETEAISPLLRLDFSDSNDTSNDRRMTVDVSALNDLLEGIYDSAPN